MTLHNEALKGTGPIPIDQGIYETSSTQKATLGTRVAFADGRVFRYGRCGATKLRNGLFVTSAAPIATNCLNIPVGAAAVTGTYDVLIATHEPVTTAAEGYLMINDAQGEGVMYKIKTCAADTGTSTNWTSLGLYDPIVLGLVTASEATIVFNPYDVLTLVSATTDSVVGVPPIQVPIGYYFWVQTWGLSNVLANGTAPAGCLLVAAASGAATIATTGLNALVAPQSTGASITSLAVPVGYQYGTVGVSGEFKPVWLQIAP